MEICKGVSSFAGVAIGKILYYHRGEYRVRQSMADSAKKEIEKFSAAREAVKSRLLFLYEHSPALSQERSYALERQMKLLEEGSFSRAVESLVMTEKVTAAYAVMTTRDGLTSSFRNLKDEAAREQLENVKQISNRLILELGGTRAQIDLGEEPVILISEELTPTELLEMDKEKLLAVVTHQGSTISHTSIMIRSMAMPALLDIEIREEWNGCQAVVDGYTGTLYVEPAPEILREYEMRRQADLKEKKELLKLRDRKDVTTDGKEIGIFANINSLDDLSSVLFYGAAGIGLLRSEFQYLGRESYPRENELFRDYRRVADTMGEKPVVIRTVDLGADRQADYMDIPGEANPIMGNRGIRLCLDRKRMFRTQLRAIYRASAYGNLSIMYPMITSESELDEIEALTEEVKAGLREKKVPFREIRRGIMVETPAAALISDRLAKRVDFLSLGTNDLSQYTLAMDRQNPYLKSKYDDHHPAILKMIQMVVENGHRENCQVYICGELAADTELTETFLRMGVDALSVVPACVLPVRKAVLEAFAGRKVSDGKQTF
ncbi:MAG: phosphoenolpyruvate--protein phosphotransferase [Clostridiales bacterium]|nr:phosphoenolpyruvate--protein phosphotransferase [Clostridiales bacterium]